MVPSGTKRKKFARWWPGIALLVVVAAIGSFFGPGATAAPPPSTNLDAKQLFDQKCSGCHSIGQGDKVGPDLKGVTDRRSQDWLKRWLRDPEQMLASNDPIAKELSQRYSLAMPNLGLSDADITALISFLDAESGGAPGNPPPPVTAALEGNAARGKELFTGTSRLSAGGASCRACHSVAGMGSLGGGTLGPDLTTTYGRLGDAMITWPATMPPMQAIFAGKPLTDQEKADLLAFFKTAAISQRESSSMGWLIAMAVVGGAAAVLLAHFIWRNRLRGVRRTFAPRGTRD